ncbi:MULTISPECIES: glycosyltransferase family 1 protein [unclassified Salinibacterium]|uniref:glycosyltransferase family 4 protein n=1 Tax=unclassified Salinibacterium TaxID=2632331 RepID=UPI00141FA418|nr:MULTISPECIES: glycosyltransferase family 1 protein [unclassified Salinibacterium]
MLLDATAIPRDRGGVGRYLDGVVPALQRTDVRLTVVCQPRDLAHFRKAGVNAVAAPARVASTAARLLWEQVGLPRLAKRLNADVVHSPHYTFPLFTRRRRVVTVHDLTFFSHPELHSRTKRLFFRTWIRASRWLPTSVIAPSAATADEYARITGASRSLVVVAHHGYDRDLFHEPSPEEVSEFRATLSPATDRWIAFLGTLEPRKNLVALVHGYQSALEKVPAAERPPLLLAGGPGWDDALDPAILAARRDGFDVRKVGYLPINQLRAFLGGSEIVAYPSLGEGFGLPVLEAMAAGACVLTTRRLALPEVGGDAVAYTETGHESISAALAALLNDSSERLRLRAAARHRAEEFTWESCAHSHLMAYERAADR